MEPQHQPRPGWVLCRDQDASVPNLRAGTEGTVPAVASQACRRRPIRTRTHRNAARKLRNGRPPVSVERRSDDDLLRCYREEPEIQGEAFIAIYGRHYLAVLREMQDAGLTPPEAESRVGEVFTRALQRTHAPDQAVTLRELLIGIAREAAQGPLAIPGQPASEVGAADGSPWK